MEHATELAEQSTVLDEDRSFYHKHDFAVYQVAVDVENPNTLNVAWKCQYNRWVDTDAEIGCYGCYAHRNDQIGVETILKLMPPGIVTNFETGQAVPGVHHDHRYVLNSATFDAHDQSLRMSFMCVFTYEDTTGPEAITMRCLANQPRGMHPLTLPYED